MRDQGFAPGDDRNDLLAPSLEVDTLNSGAKLRSFLPIMVVAFLLRTTAHYSLISSLFFR